MRSDLVAQESMKKVGGSPGFLAVPLAGGPLPSAADRRSSGSSSSAGALTPALAAGAFLAGLVPIPSLGFSNLL